MSGAWPTVRLAGLVENGDISYGIVQPGSPCDQGVPIVRVKDLRNGVVDTRSPLRVAPSVADAYRRTSLRGGELLLSIVGTIGEAAVVPESMAGWNVARAIAVIRPTEVSSAWIRLCLQTAPVQRALDAALNTTVQATLNLADLKRLEIPVPPRGEREAITEVISALESKIAANERTMRLTEELADAKFRHVGTIARVERRTLAWLADRKALQYSDGYRTKRSELGSPGLRILRAGDIRSYRIVPTGPDFVSDQYRASIGAKVSREGDILLTTKGTVGRVAVVPAAMEAVVYSPQVCYFRVLNESLIDYGYLTAWFKGRDLVDQLSLVMHKSDMAPYVNLQDIGRLQVPIPDIETQRAKGEFQRLAIGLLHALGRENNVLSNTRTKLLPMLMSGRIRVRDAEKLVEEVV
ncbi:restriction endonuclease subunit S [Verrucosispora sp. WMMD703]|uniref:restriction endonuclease subunit S n=1 Tax=Verrucosispora sp. WMMD703 TaxID=3403463 RepID=UPI003B9505A5